jgi:hypothetical protein
MVPVLVAEVAGASLRVTLSARERVPRWGLNGECGVTAQCGRKLGSSPADLLDPFWPITGHRRHWNASAV